MIDVTHHARADIAFSPRLFTTTHSDFVKMSKMFRKGTATDDKTVASFRTPRRFAVDMEKKSSTGDIAWFWKRIFNGSSFVCVFGFFLLWYFAFLVCLFLFVSTVHTSLTLMQT